MFYEICRGAADLMASGIRDSWLYGWFASPAPAAVRDSPFTSSAFIRRLLKLRRWVASRRFNSRVPARIAIPLLITLLLILTFQRSPIAASYAAVFLCLFAIAWLHIDISFTLLIFFLVFSPKLPLPWLSANPASLYLSDFALAAILLAALIRVSPPGLRRISSSLDTPILVYLIVAALSTIRGVLIHTIDNPLMGLFHFVKRIEYFSIYYLALYHIVSKERAKFHVLSILAAGSLLGAYGIYEHFHPLVFTPYSAYRIYERGWFQGQANHFAGLLLISICVAVSLALYSRTIFEKARYCLASLVMLPAFLWTYSRQAYLAGAAAIAGLIFLKKRRYLLTAALLLLAVFISCPPEIKQRIASIGYAIKSENAYYSSWGGKLWAWRMELPDFLRYPVLGIGLGARHRAMYDSQYVMELCEAGLAGFLCFGWLILEVLRLLAQSWRRQTDAFIKGLSLGALAGFAGITLQAAASSLFIVTRVAGPLWFLVGIVAVFRDDRGIQTQRGPDGKI
jgi:hypothetical protein